MQSRVLGRASRRDNASRAAPESDDAERGHTLTSPESGARGASRADEVVAFIDAGEEDVAEVDGPDPIIDFLEAEDVLLERVRDEDQALLEPDGPRVRHPLGNAVARVLDRREAPRVGAGRRMVQRGGRPAPEKLVWALVVVARRCRGRETG